MAMCAFYAVALLYSVLDRDRVQIAIYGLLLVLGVVNVLFHRRQRQRGGLNDGH